MTEKAVKEGRAFLVLVSEEASDNTRKMFTNMCTYYKVPLYFFGTKEELGPLHGQGDACIGCRTGQRFGESTRETVESEWRR